MSDTPTIRDLTMREVLQNGIDDGDREFMRECLKEVLLILDTATPFAMPGRITRGRLIPDPVVGLVRETNENPNA